MLIRAKDHGAAGDGVADDTAALQACLDALGPEGGTVWLDAGTYRVNLLRLNRPNQQLCGEGAGSVLRAVDGAVAHGIGYGNLLEITAADCRVAALICDGNWAGNAALLAQTPRDLNQHAIYAEGALRLRVEDCAFTGNRRTPLLLSDGCAEFQVLRNRFVGYTVNDVGVDDFPGSGNSDQLVDTTSRFAILARSLTGSQSSSLLSAYGLIAGNVFTDWFRCIMNQFPDLSIIDNTFRGSTRTYDCNQIELYNLAAPYPYRCIVSRNRFYGGWSQAIQLSACDGTICDDNIIVGVAASGITPPVDGTPPTPGRAFNWAINAGCPNLTIRGNHVASYRVGVYAQRTATGVLVTDNQVTDVVTDTSQLGIGIYSAAPGARLAGNYVERGGIVAVGDGYTLDGNVVYPRGAGNPTVGYAAGLFVQSGTKGARIVGNLVDGLLSDGTYPSAAGAEAGIRADAPQGAVFVGNMSRNHGRYGLALHGGTDCMLSSNRVADNGSSGSQRYGLWINGGTRIRVDGTNATESGAGGRDTNHRQQYGFYACAPLVDVATGCVSGNGNTDALVRTG